MNLINCSRPLSAISRFLAIFAMLSGSAKALEEWDWISPQPFGFSIKQVGYTGTSWVGLGESGMLIISPDGEHWETTRSLPLQLQGFVAGQRRLFAYSENGPFYIGKIGGDLTRAGEIPLPLVYSVKPYAGKLHALGATPPGIGSASGMGIAISADGASWERNALDSPVFRQLSHNGTLWLGYDADDGAIFRSVDARQWSLDATLPDVVKAVVALQNGRTFALDWSGRIYERTAPETWSLRSNLENAFAGAFIETLVSDGDLLLALGDWVYLSSDGINWVEASTLGENLDLAPFLKDAHFAGGRWIAGGESVLFSSADADQWQPQIRSLTRETIVGLGQASDGSLLGLTNEGSILQAGADNIWTATATGLLARDGLELHCTTTLDGQLFGFGNGVVRVDKTSPSAQILLPSLGEAATAGLSVPQNLFVFRATSSSRGLFAITRQGHLLESQNGGANWILSAVPVPAGERLHDLAVSDSLLLLTTDAGTTLSRAPGQDNWNIDKLHSSALHALGLNNRFTLSDDFGLLFEGDGQGVWETRDLALLVPWELAPIAYQGGLLGLDREGFLHFFTSPSNAPLRVLMDNFTADLRGLHDAGDQLLAYGWDGKLLATGNHPENLRATGGLLTAGVRLTWAPVSHATGYRIFRSLNPQSNQADLLVADTGNPQTSWLDTSAIPGQHYFYRVQPIRTRGIEALSRPVSGYRRPANEGSLALWGNDDEGSARPPESLLNAQLLQLSAGFNHYLALLQDGSVVAGGRVGLYQETIVPADLPPARSVAAAYDYNLVLLQDGTVRQWGNDNGGAWAVPAGLSNVRAISAQGAMRVALLEDGSLRVWGAISAAERERAEGLQNVKAIASGGFHALALHQNGTVSAFGQNTQGQTDVPADLEPVQQIAAGWLHSLVLTETGKVFAWGDNSHGQTDIPADFQTGSASQRLRALATKARNHSGPSPRRSPRSVEGLFISAISASFFNNFVIADGYADAAGGDERSDKTSIPDEKQGQIGSIIPGWDFVLLQTLDDTLDPIAESFGEIQYAGDNWAGSAWFGWFQHHHWPWIAHAQNGWQFVAAIQGRGLWLWELELGFIYIESSFWPYFFRSSENRWYYQQPGSTWPRRWFYHPDLDEDGWLREDFLP